MNTSLIHFVTSQPALANVVVNDHAVQKHVRHIVILLVFLLSGCTPLPVAMTPISNEGTMNSTQKPSLISAEVLLRSASGRAVDGTTIITAATIKEYAPAPESVAKAQKVFADAGFQVASLVGISFSISGPSTLFTEFFKTRLQFNARSGVLSINSDGSTSYELPLNALPKSISDLVIAVTFSPPPDFGPSDFASP
jgi:hypothetical protein